MSKELSNLIAIIEFLGQNITDDQVLELADRAKKLSMEEHSAFQAHALLNNTKGLYTELSMHRGEMGW